MTRTVLTPTNNNINIIIPNNYIGKEIEILCYATAEIKLEKPIVKKTMANFFGILSENDYQSLKIHTEKARQEWNRNI